ncbi:MAG: hypothetical protein AAFX06_23060 [Planctomycetota bacterium]
MSEKRTRRFVSQRFDGGVSHSFRIVAQCVDQFDAAAHTEASGKDCDGGGPDVLFNGPSEGQYASQERQAATRIHSAEFTE